MFSVKSSKCLTTELGDVLNMNEAETVFTGLNSSSHFLISRKGFQTYYTEAENHVGF